jgi:Haspin like kinase domain
MITKHRDLHWGNILVEDTATRRLKYQFIDRTVEIRTSSIQVVFIDFTMSRYRKNTTQEVFYKCFDDDPELFEGTGALDEDGDLQFGIMCSNARHLQVDEDRSWVKLGTISSQNKCLLDILSGRQT